MRFYLTLASTAAVLALGLSAVNAADNTAPAGAGVEQSTEGEETSPGQENKGIPPTPGDMKEGKGDTDTGGATSETSPGQENKGIPPTPEP